MHSVLGAGPTTVAMAGTALSILVVALFALVTWSAVVRIGGDEVGLLTVGGEVRSTLAPGLSFVPPFVSSVNRLPARASRTVCDVDANVRVPGRGEASVACDLVVDSRLTDPERAVESFGNRPFDAAERLARAATAAVLEPCSAADLYDLHELDGLASLAGRVELARLPWDEIDGNTLRELDHLADADDETIDELLLDIQTVAAAERPDDYDPVVGAQAFERLGLDELHEYDLPTLCAEYEADELAGVFRGEAVGEWICEALNRRASGAVSPASGAGGDDGRLGDGLPAEWGLRFEDVQVERFDVETLPDAPKPDTRVVLQEYVIPVVLRE